ncbi:hypothetical protein B0H65DRAFT_252815 [Neurospora tetraspora]|uniref:Uncharacterized protein n=1 Tax=Neurospora tetraspora TaxID=94610 RepID=A0AAE0JAS4_9PEZI|nr:hypothetical protein B0H65DRAFT_252815 [Neurospora tetraspora]
MFLSLFLCLPNHPCSNFSLSLSLSLSQLASLLASHPLHCKFFSLFPSIQHPVSYNAICVTIHHARPQPPPLQHLLLPTSFLPEPDLTQQQASTTVPPPLRIRAA